MKNRLSLLLLLMIGGFIACKKSSPPNYPVSNAMLEAFNFQQGTYWIYQDSATGLIDSFYVTDNTGIQSLTASGNQFTTQQLIINVTEVNIYPQPVQNYSLTWGYQFAGNTIVVVVSESKIYTNQIQYAPLTNYPFGDTSINGYGAGGAWYPQTIVISSIYPSVNIFSTTYSNVAAVNYNCNLTALQNSPLINSPYSYNDWLFITPYIGLIKIVQNHPQDNWYRNWSLLRCHIKS